ncbi:zinc-binding dehydrogenase [Propionibacteriaceae bacterium G1746]|uniref:zinc-binding dehydrogenase n=1 Tax=Aestuariimicrobium sp. G57 TaxID=3418485 RepID=UPI003C211212
MTYAASAPGAIPSTMRALVKRSRTPGDVALVERPVPTPGPGQVLIRIVAAAVCGSDRSEINGKDTGLVPRALGHEAAGIIAAVGDDVQVAPGARPWQVGDRVTVETDAVLCMACRWCRTEQYNRCPNRLGIGRTADGALADYLVMPARALHLLPDTVPLLSAALTEPTAVSVHAVIEQSPSLAGEVVVVIGPGAVGQLCAQVARAAGATVIMAGLARHEARLSTALQSGIHHVVRTDVEDLAAVVAEVSGGDMAHTVFECSGQVGELERAGALLAKGGRLVLVAFYKSNPDLDIMQVVQNELEVVGSRGKRASSFRTALRLMSSGAIDTAPVITQVLPLEDWERGIDLVGRGEKVVFAIDPEVVQRDLAADEGRAVV